MDDEEKDASPFAAHFHRSFRGAVSMEGKMDKLRRRLSSVREDADMKASQIAELRQKVAALEASLNEAKEDTGLARCSGVLAVLRRLAGKGDNYDTLREALTDELAETEREQRALMADVCRRDSNLVVSPQSTVLHTKSDMLAETVRELSASCTKAITKANASTDEARRLQDELQRRLGELAEARAERDEAKGFAGRVIPLLQSLQPLVRLMKETLRVVRWQMKYLGKASPGAVLDKMREWQTDNNREMLERLAMSQHDFDAGKGAPESLPELYHATEGIIGKQYADVLRELKQARETLEEYKARYADYDELKQQVQMLMKQRELLEEKGRVMNEDLRDSQIESLRAKIQRAVLGGDKKRKQGLQATPRDASSEAGASPSNDPLDLPPLGLATVKRKLSMCSTRSRASSVRDTPQGSFHSSREDDRESTLGSGKWKAVLRASTASRRLTSSDGRKKRPSGEAPPSNGLSTEEIEELLQALIQAKDENHRLWAKGAEMRTQIQQLRARIKTDRETLDTHDRARKEEREIINRACAPSPTQQITPQMQITRLSKEVKLQQLEIEEMREKLQKVERDKKKEQAQQQAVVQDLRNEILRLAQDNLAERAKVLSLTEAQIEHQQKVDATEHAESLSTEQRDELRQVAADLERRLQLLGEEIHAAQTREATARSMLNEAHEEIDELKSRLFMIEQQNRKLSQQRLPGSPKAPPKDPDDDVFVEAARLRNKVTTLGTELRRVGRVVEEADRIKDSLQLQREELLKEKKEAFDKVASLHIQNEALRVEVDSLRVAIAEERTQHITEKDNGIALRAELGDRLREIQSLQGSVQRKEERIRELQSLLGGPETVDNMLGLQARMETRMNHLNAMLASAEVRANGKEAEIKDMEGRMQVLENAMHKMGLEKDEWREKAHRLQSRAEALQKRVDELTWEAITTSPKKSKKQSPPTSPQRTPPRPASPLQLGILSSPPSPASPSTPSAELADLVFTLQKRLREKENALAELKKRVEELQVENSKMGEALGSPEGLRSLQQSVEDAEADNLLLKMRVRELEGVLGGKDAVAHGVFDPRKLLEKVHRLEVIAERAHATHRRVRTKGVQTRFVDEGTEAPPIRVTVTSSDEEDPGEFDLTLRGTASNTPVESGVEVEEDKEAMEGHMRTYILRSRDLLQRCHTAEMKLAELIMTSFKGSTADEIDRRKQTLDILVDFQTRCHAAEEEVMALLMKVAGAEHGAASGRPAERFQAFYEAKIKDLEKMLLVKSREIIAQDDLVDGCKLRVAAAALEVEEATARIAISESRVGAIAELQTLLMLLDVEREERTQMEVGQAAAVSRMVWESSCSTIVFLKEELNKAHMRVADLRASSPARRVSTDTEDTPRQKRTGRAGSLRWFGANHGGLLKTGQGAKAACVGAIAVIVHITAVGGLGVDYLPPEYRVQYNALRKKLMDENNRLKQAANAKVAKAQQDVEEALRREQQAVQEAQGTEKRLGVVMCRSRQLELKLTLQRPMVCKCMVEALGRNANGNYSISFDYEALLDGTIERETAAVLNLNTRQHEAPPSLHPFTATPSNSPRGEPYPNTPSLPHSVQPEQPLRTESLKPTDEASSRAMAEDQLIAPLGRPAGPMLFVPHEDIAACVVQVLAGGVVVAMLRPTRDIGVNTTMAGLKGRTQGGIRRIADMLCERIAEQKKGQEGGDVLATENKSPLDSPVTYAAPPVLPVSLTPGGNDLAMVCARCSLEASPSYLHLQRIGKPPRPGELKGWNVAREPPVNAVKSTQTEDPSLPGSIVHGCGYRTREEANSRRKQSTPARTVQAHIVVPGCKSVSDAGASPRSPSEAMSPQKGLLRTPGSARRTGRVVVTTENPDVAEHPLVSPVSPSRTQTKQPQGMKSRRSPSPSPSPSPSRTPSPRKEAPPATPSPRTISSPARRTESPPSPQPLTFDLAQSQPVPTITCREFGTVALSPSLYTVPAVKSQVTLDTLPSALRCVMGSVTQLFAPSQKASFGAPVPYQPTAVAHACTALFIQVYSHLGHLRARVNSQRVFVNHSVRRLQSKYREMQLEAQHVHRDVAGTVLRLLHKRTEEKARLDTLRKQLTATRHELFVSCTSREDTGLKKVVLSFPAQGPLRQPRKQPQQRARHKLPTRAAPLLPALPA